MRRGLLGYDGVGREESQFAFNDDVMGRVVGDDDIVASDI